MCDVFNSVRLDYGVKVDILMKELVIHVLH